MIPKPKLVTEAPWWEAIKPGDELTWMHVPRGGWGYEYPVDATVIKVNPQTVRIEVKTKDGRIVRRNVQPTSLRRKQTRKANTGGEGK